MAPLDGIHWRDCAGWKASNLELSTTSNEAAKLYDLCNGQFLSLYKIDGPEDGLGANLSRLVTEFPDFVMGQAFHVALRLATQDANGRNDPDLAAAARRLHDLTLDPNSKLTGREKMHIQAVKYKCDGFLEEATEVYQRILRAHPLDMLAQKMSSDLCFALGNPALMRDSVLRVKPAWTPDMPLYSYLDSIAAFGYEECGMYSRAKECATAALSFNPHDVWATHSMTHVYAMQGLNEEGVAFLEGTFDNWEPCGLFACHVMWHQALLNIERGNPEAAMQLYDSQIYKRASQSKSMLNLCDTVSLLKRLEFNGASVGERWDDVYELCRPHAEDHVWAFNDTHMLMAFLNCRKGGELAKRHMESVVEYANEYKSATKMPTNARVTEVISLPLSRALVAYQEGRYGEVVELVYPVRDMIYRMGGSHAQRDIYEQVLLNACIQSKSEDNTNLARALLNERQASKASSAVTDKLVAKLLAVHTT